MLQSTLMQDRAFVSTWNTENAGSATKTIVIPTSSTGTYSCTVDWGDGTTNYMTTYNDTNWTHVYGSTGTYTVKIYGKFVGMVFANAGDKAKILTITKWGIDFRLGTTQSNYFFGCSNLTITATDVLNLQGTTILDATFDGCTSLTTVPSINSWNTSAVTSMGSMFRSSAFNQSLSSWNTASVTNMSSMFRSNASFNQDISAWTTTALTNLNATFQSATAFNQSLSSWNTSLVTNMISMFQSATSFNSALAWGSNTLKVTNMTSMFNGASAFNQDVSGWSIAALTNATTMFTSSAFAITNYNLLLDSVAGWPSQGTINNSVTFSAGTAHYSGANAIAGRATLATTHTWTITDGGTP